MAKIKIFLKVVTFVTFMLCLHADGVFSDKSGCNFPESWSGEWYQHGIGNITLSSTYMYPKGYCVQQSDDKFYVKDEIEDVYRCLIINEKHHNVLQYRESDASYADEGLAQLCDMIEIHDSLHTLIRLNPIPIPCPFKNAPFNFSYYSGDKKLCSTPVSKVASCADESQLHFYFEACHDVEGSQAKSQAMQCIAEWKLENGLNYVITSVMRERDRGRFIFDVSLSGESYRCLLYQNTTARDSYISTDGKTFGHHTVIQNYKIAISDVPASCDGLRSVDDGSERLELRKDADFEEPEIQPHCHFPSWVVNPKWRSLNGIMTLEPINNHIISVNITANGIKSNELLPHGVTKWTCRQIEDRVDEWYIEGKVKKTVVLVETHFGCMRPDVQCLSFYKRADNIIDVDFGIPTTIASVSKCDNVKSDKTKKRSQANPPNIYTFISTTHTKPEKCPPIGQLFMEEQRIDDLNENRKGNYLFDSCLSPDYSAEIDNFNSKEINKAINTPIMKNLVSGCDSKEPSKMTFNSNCFNDDDNSNITPYEFECIGSWHVGVRHNFTILVPAKSDGLKMFCLAISRKKLTETFRISVLSNSCFPPGAAKNIAYWRTNSTVASPCPIESKPDAGTIITTTATIANSNITIIVDFNHIKNQTSIGIKNETAIDIENENEISTDMKNETSTGITHSVNETSGLTDNTADANMDNYTLPSQFYSGAGLKITCYSLWWIFILWIPTWILV